MLITVCSCFVNDEPRIFVSKCYFEGSKYVLSSLKQDLGKYGDSLGLIHTRELLFY